MAAMPRVPNSCRGTMDHWSRSRTTTDCGLGGTVQWRTEVRECSRLAVVGNMQVCSKSCSCDLSHCSVGDIFTCACACARCAHCHAHRPHGTVAMWRRNTTQRQCSANAVTTQRQRSYNASTTQRQRSANAAPPQRCGQAAALAVACVHPWDAAAAVIPALSHSTRAVEIMPTVQMRTAEIN